MDWFDLYFETKVLMVVIPVLLVGVVLIIAGAVSIFKKIADRVYKRQIKNTKADWYNEKD